MNQSIGIGYGSAGFALAGSRGLVVDSEQFDGWLVCEWYHGVNLPQLFQLIKVFDNPNNIFPASCAKAKLIPKWI